MLQRLLHVGVVIWMLLSLVPAAVAHAEAPLVLPKLAISEIQTGGVDADNTEDPTMEFVELYNPADTALNITNWRVQYLSASGKTATDLALLSGTVAAKSYVLLSYNEYLPNADIYFGQDKASGILAKTGGQIRILDETGTTIDLVGWGSAELDIGWTLVPKMNPGFSVKRIFPDDPLASTGVVFTDATLPPTPEGGGYIPAPPEITPSDDDNDTSTATPLSCEGIVLTELLPNPSGPDTGHEFIELYNPTDEIISLDGCALQTTASSKLFLFGDISLQPQAYEAFYDSVTNLALPNAAGGTVWLLSADDVELQTATYPPSLDDDVAWMLMIDGIWQSTYAPTPGAENITMPLKPCEVNEVRDETTGRCVTPTTSNSGELAPCKEGQERNPATNRCRSTTTVDSALTPCKPGQARRPETNRCHAVLGTATTLQRCKAGEERNPATNRCRKITTTADTLTACKTGYERNPETNRCRKAAGPTATLANVQDVESGQAASKNGWYVTGSILLIAIVYAIYEYRQELFEKLRKLKK